MRKVCSRWRTPPTSRQMPTTPLQMIMMAAKMVSRGRVALSGPPASITEKISATSMMVTATASTRVPKGSPTRWATTSAWWTAAMTAPTMASAAATSNGVPGLPATAPARTAMARAGSRVCQWCMPRFCSTHLRP